jgi:hypothetical protein
MHIVAPGRAVWSSGALLAPGDPVPASAVDDALIASGAVVAEPEVEHEHEPAAEAPAKKEPWLPKRVTRGRK